MPTSRKRPEAEIKKKRRRARAQRKERERLEARTLPASAYDEDALARLLGRAAAAGMAKGLNRRR